MEAKAHLAQSKGKPGNGESSQTMAQAALGGRGLSFTRGGQAFNIMQGTE